MHLILHYLKRYKIYVFFNLLAILGFATADLGIPTIVSRMIDNGIILNDRAYIYKMGAAILAVAVAGGIGNVLLAYCSSLVSSRVTRDIRNDIFRNAQEFSHTEYNKFGISSMITRTTNDAFILMQFINIILRTALLTPIMIIISMFMVIRTSMTLSMVIGGCVPIICLGVYLIARTSNPISTRQQKGLDKLNRITRENLTGVRVIRAFCKDEYETEPIFRLAACLFHNARAFLRLLLRLGLGIRLNVRQLHRGHFVLNKRGLRFRLRRGFRRFLGSGLGNLRQRIVFFVGKLRHRQQDRLYRSALFSGPDAQFG